MATKRFTATSEWTKISEAGSAPEDHFQLRNLTGFEPLLLALGSKPESDLETLPVYAYEGFSRAQIAGDLWVKASPDAYDHLNRRVNIDFILMY